jgi:hypothetical protein
LVAEFQNNLTPDEFKRIQKHAQTELLKFAETAATPKKKAISTRQKVKR